MGAKLAMAATSHGRHLAAREYKALMVMALTALDEPSKGRPARLYFGGWERISEAIGRDVPPDEPENGTRRTALRHEVTKVMGRLRDAGLVRPMNTPHRRQMANYGLLLDDNSVDDPTHQSGQKRGQIDPESVDRLTHLDGSDRPPQGTNRGTNRGTKGGGPTSASKPRPRQRPAPLPDDWEPNDKHQQIADERGLDLGPVVESFKAHARANDKRRVDWDAEFEKWLWDQHPPSRDQHRQPLPANGYWPSERGK